MSDDLLDFVRTGTAVRTGFQCTAHGRPANKTRIVPIPGSGSGNDDPPVCRDLLSIGVYPNTVSGALPTAIQRLQRARPDLRVATIAGTDSELITGLNDGRVDVVLGREPSLRLRGSLVFESLYQEPLVFVTRPGHQLGYRSLIHPQDLTGYQLLVPGYDSVLVTEVQRYLSTESIPAAMRLADKQLHVPCHSLVALDDSVLITPLGAAAEAIERLDVIRLPIERRVPNRAVGLLYPHCSRASPWIRPLARLLQGRPGP